MFYCLSNSPEIKKRNPLFMLHIRCMIYNIHRDIAYIGEFSTVLLEDYRQIESFNVCVFIELILDKIQLKSTNVHRWLAYMLATALSATWQTRHIESRVQYSWDLIKILPYVNPPSLSSYSVSQSSQSQSRGYKLICCMFHGTEQQLQLQQAGVLLRFCWVQLS